MFWAKLLWSAWQWFYHGQFNTSCRDRLLIPTYPAHKAKNRINKGQFARFGYNRDGKRDKLQVVISMTADTKGRPVSVEVFEGNTKDS